ncbi:MAG: hypothetical protein M3P42_03250 [Actinomycetota bacterium]|nr:hypothetical protein [Actinomycetota bacterium]
MRRALVAAAFLALVLAPGAAAAERARLTEDKATAAFLRHGKVADWLDRYPVKGRVKDAEFDSKTNSWTVHVWWDEAGEIATGKVDDASGRVTEAWTGPQVAWKMARGYEGAFGGKSINRVDVWLAFCAIFLLGLVDWRRPLSLRTLDLVALLSFTVPLWFFNDGNVFASMSLVYPPLAYLLARMAWVGVRGRSSSTRAAVWPVWVLLAATIFLAGFRIGLNLEDSNVIDVGYAGVIGAHRIANGEMPYGHMPAQGKLKKCGDADAEGEVRERIQTNGRCESSNERGDTYGPVSYMAYLPGFWLLGWSGKWDSLPAAHFTSIALDLLVMLGLALVGRRFGGLRLAVVLPFAWAAYPFTQYVSSSNTNDALPALMLVWGFWLASSHFGRGVFSALAGWSKFGSLLVVPLWASYPDGLRRPRGPVVFGVGFLVATLASFWILLLESDPLHAARVFWDRTVGWQVTRESPFSIWDWGQYHAAGIPDLHLVQLPLIGLVLASAMAFTLWPRRKSPLQLAALTGALLVGFELVLTHWFFLYIPWFFPFVAFAVLAPSGRRSREEEAVEAERPVPELVPTG